MHARTHKNIFAAAVGLALAGWALTAAPAAFAQQGPSALPIAGSVSLPTSLTLSFTSTGFLLTTTDMAAALENVNTPSYAVNDPGYGIITVGSNDTAGYAVEVSGPAAFLAGQAQLPTSDISADVITGDNTAHAYSPLPTPGSGLTVMSCKTVSGSYQNNGAPAGEDAVPFYGFAINTIPVNLPGGTYTGNVTMTLWGN